MSAGQKAAVVHLGASNYVVGSIKSDFRKDVIVKPRIQSLRASNVSEVKRNEEVALGGQGVILSSVKW